MSIDSEKSRLREFFRKERTALSKESMVKKSQQINEKFIEELLPQLLLENHDKIFSLYLEASNEVATGVIAEHFKKNHIKFSYPKIIAGNLPLEFFLCEKNQEFEPSKLYSKLLEPKAGEKILPDILIMPLLAFDENLSRLGMGGGFFDRTISLLKKQKSQIITIGLAYEFQRAQELLPIENTDQRLDFIVTEKSVFSAS